MASSKPRKPVARKKAKTASKRGIVASGSAAPQKASTLPPVVAVGASAGGLDALKLVFGTLPTATGMVFILLQHLPAEAESHLPELLQKQTRLPVKFATHGMELRPDTLLVVPPSHEAEILSGRISLIARDPTAESGRPIDRLFTSLATFSGNRAIAVVLSGAGTDGCVGIKEVKERGGFVIAQEAASAKFDLMPASAIATGCVDLVLAPREIGRELGRMSHSRYLTLPVELAKEILPVGKSEELEPLYDLLKNSVGIDFRQYKDMTIKRRIARRMALHKLGRLKDYVRYVQSAPTELERLHTELLINVTRFFRDAPAFEQLKRVVFPTLMRDRGPANPVRVWIPGCSTGEEAYSLAICLLEHLEQTKLRCPIQIFATDVSDAALDRARRGVYPKSITSEVSSERLQRYFQEAEDGYHIEKSVRELCVFARHNVAVDPPFSRMDVVSCRNLLIYFTPPLQKKVLTFFHYALRPRGFLILGLSETSGPAVELFTSLDKKNKFYTRKGGVGSPRLDLGRSLLLSERTPTVRPQPVRPDVDSPLRDVQREADRIVLARYSPPGMVVNAKLEIVQIRGNPSAYLEPPAGDASLHLLRMLRRNLHRDIHGALHKAQRSLQPVRKENLSLASGEDQRRFNLEVLPLPDASTGELHFLVLFEDANPAPPQISRRSSPAHKRAGEVTALRKELEATQEYLQSIIEEQETTNEELRAANEQIQSSNEELQSTNEEMETAKEELQSTNEELGTVNEELQNRNVEITQINNDLTNLLGSVNIPIVMVGNDLRIRRYTPMAERILNLISTDIGRPISDIKTNLNTPEFDGWVARVINNLSVEEHEVQSREGHWYSLHIRPYRTSDHKIDGAVISFIDIHRLKQKMQELIGLREYAGALAETVREPLLILDRDLRVQSASRSFVEKFRVTSATTEGRLISELGNGQWNIPELLRMLQLVLSQGVPITDYRVEHDFPTIGFRVMMVNARRVQAAVENVKNILLAIEDATPAQS